MTRERENRPGGMLGAALAEQADRLSHCVHCGFCLPACPTYTRLGDEADSPRGRLHLMSAVAEGRLSSESPAFQRHLDRCLGCRACESVCPSGVEYGYLLERAREVAVEARSPSLLQRSLLQAIGHAALFYPWMWASRLLRASRLPAVLGRRWGRREEEGGVAGRVRLGAAMLAASAPARLLSRRAGPDSKEGLRGGGLQEEEDAREERGVVALLTGCVQDQLFRRVNDASRRVLEINGWRVVEVPTQGCCGALHAHGGELGTARAMAQRNVAAFQKHELDYVVVNAAGCGAIMREYGELLDEAGASFSKRVVDITFLLAGEGRTPAKGGPIPLVVTYDAPCHLLHGQRVSGVGERLLSTIPELELRPLEGDGECCGGAGIYGITHPELGGRIGRDKALAVARTGCQVVATGNPGCMMQIGAHLRLLDSPVEVAHPVEILDASYAVGGRYG